MFEGVDAGAESATYQVLARRTRPQAFSELVGQTVVARALEGILARKKIPHAFLFTGTRGTGKTSSARILAKSLCCAQGPTATPCQTCVHCTQITACAHEDVLEIDGASNTGVDNIRELRESARFYPNSARYKIYIIDEVHMLSIGAFNALLKTLEEPPPQVVFILATTELHKVPITVRSRCMIFSFRKVDPETIASHLKAILDSEGVTAEDDALALVAREAKGSLRDALSLLEQVLALEGGSHVTAETARAALSVMGEEIAEALFDGILARDAAQVLEALRSADAACLDMGSLLETSAGMFRAALIIKDAKDTRKAQRLAQLLPSEFERIRSRSARTSSAALSEIFRTLSLAAKDLTRTNSPLAWAELAALDCVARADWLSSGELLGLLSGKSSGVAGSPAPAASESAPTGTQLGATPSWPASVGADQSPTPPRGSGVGARSGAAPPSPARMPQAAVGDAEAPHAAQPELGSAVAEGIDMILFSKLVSIIERKSLGLSTKLKHASLEAFHPRLVSFADIPQNKVYTQMNDVDAKHFVDALRECGLDGAELRGIVLPKGVSWKTAPAMVAHTQGSPPSGATQALQGAGPATPTTTANMAPSGAPSTAPAASLARAGGAAAFLDKLGSADPFGDTPPSRPSGGPHGESEKKKNALSPSPFPTADSSPGARQADHPAFSNERAGSVDKGTAKPSSDRSSAAPSIAPQRQAPDRATSLAQIEHAQKLKELHEREEKIKSLPPIQKLARLATKLEFVPIENDERREH